MVLFKALLRRAGIGGDLCGHAERPFWACPRASEVEGVNGLNMTVFF